MLLVLLFLTYNLEFLFHSLWELMVVSITMQVYSLHSERLYFDRVSDKPWKARYIMYAIVIPNLIF